MLAGRIDQLRTAGAALLRMLARELGEAINDLTARRVARGRWSGGDQMTQDIGQNSTFSPQRAFVVQFHAETRVEAGRLVGRVEHVISGQAAHFRSLDALLVFLARMLGEVQGAQGALQAQDSSGAASPLWTD
jgi:hypothetical protein